MKHVARVGLFWLSLSALPACELIVDFDRSKVTPEDAGTPPDNTGNMDAGQQDAATPDGGESNGDDAMMDDEDAGT